MKSILYVFSSTGNCLTTARKLSGLFTDCQIVPIAALAKHRKILVEAETVGFLFPVYYGNMPYPVREVIGKMVFNKDPYIFCFTTCRGHVGAAPQRLDQLLRTRGQVLSCAANIFMPGNSFLNEEAADQAYLEAQDHSIRNAAQPILHREVYDYSSQEVLPLTPVDYPNNFRGITADDSCIGCGTCVRLCPMGNIRIIDGKALIGDDCATCLTCFHWCPVEAVYMSRQAEIARRRKYHHPDIQLRDIQKMKQLPESSASCKEEILYDNA